MSNLPRRLLELPIAATWFTATVTVVAAVVVVLLAARRRPGWSRRAAAAVVIGAASGASAPAVLTHLELLPELMPAARWWIVGGLAAVGLAMANLWRATIRRRVAALGATLGLLATCGVQVNAAYGLNPTLGSLLGSTSTELDLTALPPGTALPPSPTSPTAPAWPAGAPGRPLPTADAPLWRTWKAPADLPATGRLGTVAIPGAVSGFAARPASVYLPPAALVADPPRLPVLVFMMGQPGNPDASFAGATLNRLAATHHGLAPIVVVADQLGATTQDPLCLDSTRFGKAQTYVNVDVPAFIERTFRVRPERSAWVVGGYSHGGQCAASFLARYPTRWGGMLSVSGEEFPGSERESAVLAEVFHGDRAAYAAARPTALLAAGAPWTDTVAVATTCRDDHFSAGTLRVAGAARAAGITTMIHEFPACGHGGDALRAGLDAGLASLYPRWGLAPPTG